MTRPGKFTNWAGNATFAPSDLLTPASERQVADLVHGAAGRGARVRPIGSGHSSMDLAGTEHLMINLRALNGLLRVDEEARIAELGPGTLISEIGPLLWPHGLALKNQGDIDAQQLAGAISTGTHGSGLQLQSFSGSMTAATIVDGHGEVRRVDARSDTLAAVQVALGLCGVMTSVELSVRPAFMIDETIDYWTLGDLLDRWVDAFANNLHFSFFWMPASASPSIFHMNVPDGRDMADQVYVKIYVELPVLDAVDIDDMRRTTGRRIDRPYRIYPEIPTDVFHELEYMVDFDRGKEAFAAVRELMLDHFPEQQHPVEVRAVARDEAFLSPNQGRDSLVIAVHCDDLRTGEPFLRAVSETLQQFAARPHWGKWHFMSPDYVERVFPGMESFRAARQDIDPDGTFLNDYLARYFA